MEQLYRAEPQQEPDLTSAPGP